MRRLIRIVIILAIAVVLIPYAIAPFYRVIDPVSMPMLWRWATGKWVHRIVVPLNRIAPCALGHARALRRVVDGDAPVVFVADFNEPVGAQEVSVVPARLDALAGVDLSVGFDVADNNRSHGGCAWSQRMFDPGMCLLAPEESGHQ